MASSLSGHATGATLFHHFNDRAFFKKKKKKQRSTNFKTM